MTVTTIASALPAPRPWSYGHFRIESVSPSGAAFIVIWRWTFWDPGLYNLPYNNPEGS